VEISGGEEIRENRFSYRPTSFSCSVDWLDTPNEIVTDTFPIREFISTQSAGCTRNCGWCGGSRDSFRRINQCDHAIARKPPTEVAYEIDTTSARPDSRGYHFYSVGSYNEPRRRVDHLIDRIGRSPLKSVSYEQFHLTDDRTLERMVRANSRTAITLSSESHDLRVAKLAGRGVYTNEELEQWLEKALDLGIHAIDVWYFVGMPEQDEASVLGTVEYCQQLLEKFKGMRVNPMICPMIPFLDPASNFFENPAQHGYRVFYRTVEQHRRGMERASVINRINYETKWLSRSDLVHVGFKAVRALMEAKAGTGMLPSSSVREYIANIDDALDFVDVVHEVDCIENQNERARELERLGDNILDYNNMIFFSGVMNQAFPINRDIGARWFDEMGWEPEDLEAAQNRDLALDASVRQRRFGGRCPPVAAWSPRDCTAFGTAS
jgi:clorobiocin biosynthesis protein CloN6